MAAIVNHNTHTVFMAQAAIEEMHDIVWQTLSNPLSPMGNRLEVMAAVASGGEFELDLKSDLKFSNNLMSGQKKTVTKEQKKPTTAIIEATARLHNFRHIYYSPTGVYSNPTPYYISPDKGEGGNPAAGPSGTHQDFFGFITYTVKAQHGIITRTVKQSRPLKITNMSPMGRQYVLFEMDSGQGKSLNEGSALYIFGNDDARIRMDGPYNLEVGGYHTGLKGSSGAFSLSPENLPGDSATSLTYPQASKWYDNAYVPSPKWLTGCMPYCHGGRLSAFGGGAVTIQLCCLLPGLGSDQMGIFAQPNQQSWLSAKVPNSEQNFSLTGAPGVFNPFRGLLYRSGSDYDAPMGVADSWDPAKEQEIRHEGVIVGTYRTHKMQKTCICIPVYCWAVLCINICTHIWWGDPGSDMQDYYAYKGDEKPSVDWLATGMSIGMGIIGSFNVGGGTGWAGGLFAGGSATMNAAGGLLKSVGSQLAGNFMLGFSAADAFKNVQGVQPLNPDEIPNVFPQGFRILNRAAVRHFRTMDEAMWKKDTLLMDGGFWVDDINYNHNFKYVGKGFLASIANEFSGDPTVREIIPRNDNDFLTLFYLNTNPEKPLKIDAGLMKASLYSMTSIAPQRNFGLVGNLMTSTVNKEKFTKDVALTYWNKKLSEVDDYTDYNVLSVSPKIEAYVDVIMERTGTGTGDDGVEVIIGSL
jgi:hypothetical protein